MSEAVITLRVGDICVYKEGNAFLMNQVVYVNDVDENKSDTTFVCTPAPWNSPFGWGFAVKTSDLILIHHVEPPPFEKRRGYTFCPEWLESVRPGVLKAVCDFKADGGVLPT